MTDPTPATKPKHVPQRYVELTFHPHAECEDCDWTTDTGAQTLDYVKNHIRRTGHVVLVERVTRSRYGPKD